MDGQTDRQKDKVGHGNSYLLPELHYKEYKKGV